MKKIDKGVLLGYNFEEIRNIPVSKGAERIVKLGNQVNVSYTEDVAMKLMEAVDGFSFIMPVKYDGDIKEPEKVLENGMDFIINQYNYKLLNEKKLIPIFTCYGEMIKTLSKMNELDNFNQVLILDTDYIAWVISQAKVDGVVIDPDGVKIFNYS